MGFIRSGRSPDQPAPNAPEYRDAMKGYKNQPSERKLCWHESCAQYGQTMGGQPACEMDDPYPDGREPVSYYAGF